MEFYRSEKKLQKNILATLGEIGNEEESAWGGVFKRKHCNSCSGTRNIFQTNYTTCFVGEENTDSNNGCDFIQKQSLQSTMK